MLTRYKRARAILRATAGKVGATATVVGWGAQSINRWVYDNGSPKEYANDYSNLLPETNFLTEDRAYIKEEKNDFFGIDMSHDKSNQQTIDIVTESIQDNRSR